MAKNEIAVKKADTLFDEFERLNQAISRRAYDLFRNGSWGDAINDWLKAEDELVTKPAIELTQKDGSFDVLAAVPGLDMKDLDVQITPDELLIKGESRHEKKEEKDKVHISELRIGQVFRSVRFPEPIDPDSAKADYKDGVLHVTAAIAKSAARAAKKVDVKAA